MRVAFLIGPLYATKDANTGELRGVAIDSGEAWARYGVAMQPVVYRNPARHDRGAKSGEWERALMGVSAAPPRRRLSAPYMEVEQGTGTRRRANHHGGRIDRSGVRVGVLDKSGADMLPVDHAGRTATLVRVKSLGDLEALLKSAMRNPSRRPGIPVSGGCESAGRQGPRWKHPGEPLRCRAKRARPGAACAVAGFVEEAKRSGLVKSAIDNRLLGFVVAPLK